MDEQKKYEVIKSLVNHANPNKRRAALVLGCSLRHINSMIKGYLEHGKSFFIHGNRGRKPANAIPEAIRIKVIELYRADYNDTNFQHFTELLSQEKNIHISPSAIMSILDSAYILSPKATKAKKKRFREELKAKIAAAKTQREIEQIQTNLVAIENAHSRRPRAALFGELIQMDASPFRWIPGQIWHLHVAIDDSTGRIVGAYFDTQETLQAYYHVLYQILTTYGIPYKLFTDRRTVFTYKKKNSPSLDGDTYTQFAYACKQLGIELESSSVPQAKGRVERLNQTLQSRLPHLLRKAGVTTLTQANEFLHSYIGKFNKRFGLIINNTKSAFEEQPEYEKINLILAVLCERTVDAGHCLRHARKYYRMLDAQGTQVHYRPGTKVMFIQAFDGNKYCCVNDKDVYALEEIPEREEKSRNLDPDYVPTKPKKKYIPPMNHPWHRQVFSKFVRTQEHHWDDDWSA